MYFVVGVGPIIEVESNNEADNLIKPQLEFETFPKFII